MFGGAGRNFAAVAKDRVVARSGGDGIIAMAADNGIVPRAAVDSVIPCIRDDGIVVCVTKNGVIPASGGDVFDVIEILSASKPVRDRIGGHINRQIAIIVRRQNHRVRSGAAVKRVIAVQGALNDDCIVAIAAIDDIVSVATIDDVVAAARVDRVAAGTGGCAL